MTVLIFTTIFISKETTLQKFRADIMSWVLTRELTNYILLKKKLTNCISKLLICYKYRLILCLCLYLHAMSSDQSINLSSWWRQVMDPDMSSEKKGDPVMKKKGFQGEIMFLGPTSDVLGLSSFPTHHISPWKHGPTAYHTLLLPKKGFECISKKKVLGNRGPFRGSFRFSWILHSPVL